MRSSRVAVWVPPPVSGTAGGDVAELVLVGEGLPAGAGPARLAEAGDVRGAAVDVFGYPGEPPRRQDGAWAAYRLRGVVGMLAVASKDGGARDTYAIPVAHLVDAWPQVLETVPACPYRGLLPFRASDAEAGLFVGREEETIRLRRVVDEHALAWLSDPREWASPRW